MRTTTRTPARTRLPSRVAATHATLLCCVSLAACGGTASTATARTPASASSKAPAVAATTATTASAGAGGSACGLVTVDEVATATGRPMTKTGDAGGICAFSGTTDPSQLVYVQLFTDEHSMALPKQIEVGSAHLPGLGDDAFWSTSGIVFVQKGSRGVSITMPSLPVPGLDAPPAIVTLATEALGRL